MYIASVIQYLLIRRAQENGVHTKIITFMFFAPAFPFFAAYAFMNRVPLLLSPVLFLFLFGTIYLFSYLGIVCSIIGTKEAPNVGYSLIIQKSYAVYTALMAAVFLGSKLGVPGFIVIAIIILFSGIIVVDRKNTKKSANKKWFMYTLLAFFMFGNLALATKYLQSIGVSVWTLMFYITLLNTFFNGVDLVRNRGVISRGLTPSLWIILVFMGLSCGIFNLTMQFAYKYSPNVGYVNTVNTASIILVTLLSAVFFKDKLSIEKVIGVIGVTLGLILLVLLK